MVFDVGSSNRVSQTGFQRTESTQETGKLGSMTVTVGEAETPPAQTSTFADKAKAFFQKIGNFFSKIGDRISEAFHNLKARWQPEAQTPVAPTGAQPTQTQAPVVDLEPLRLSATDVFGGPDFNAQTASVDTRNIFTYGHVKEEADGIANAPLDSQSNGIAAFLRSANPQSQAAREDFRESDTATSFSDTFTGMVSDQNYPVRSAMFEKILAQNPDMTAEDLAATTVAKIDQVMVSMYGDPDVPGSIADAADRLPQSLCDHIAIAFAAIDSSDCSEEIKGKLKENVARDALALRTFCPMMIETATQSTDPVIRANGVDIAKAIQSIVNDAHFVGGAKTNTADAFANAAEPLFDRWQPAFESFTAAVLARANPEAVAQAALGAQTRAENFPTIMENWNAQIDQGIDPRVG